MVVDPAGSAGRHLAAYPHHLSSLQGQSFNSEMNKLVAVVGSKLVTVYIK